MRLFMQGAICNIKREHAQGWVLMLLLDMNVHDSLYIKEYFLIRKEKTLTLKFGTY